MKILIVNPFGKSLVIISDILPRKGDRIDMFNNLCPVVQSVLLWPSEERLKGLDENIDAIVAVK